MAPSASRRMKSSSSNSRVCESSADSGSSISRIAGRTASARAMPTRWRMPPESCFGQALRKSVSPVRFSASSIRARRSGCVSVACSNGNSTLPSTVHQGSSAKSWNTKVSGLRLPDGAAPRHSAAPELGRKRPPRIESSVLLPQPEGPTIATTSPAPTVNDTSSSTSSGPKRWLIWSAKRSIRSQACLARHARACPGHPRLAFIPVTKSWMAGSSPAMTKASSIRLHIGLVDDGLRIKTLVDEALLLQPFDLVVDVLHVELAVGIDIGAIADHLLDRQVGVFGDDLEQRLRLVVDDGLAVLHRGQDHVVIFAVGAVERGEQLRHQRLVLTRLRRGKHHTQLPRRLVADPAEQLGAAVIHQLARRRDRQQRGIDGLALQGSGRIRQRLQRHDLHVRKLEMVFIGKKSKRIMKAGADLRHRDAFAREILGRLQSGGPGIVTGEIADQGIAGLLAAHAADHLQGALAGEIVEARGEG